MSDPALINYPDDRATEAQADEHDIPVPVLVRDLVRVVEVLNLKRKGFFAPRSVLAGSMALRCFNTPRFTVYDADFSTSAAHASVPGGVKKLLTYNERLLEIAPNDPVPHDQGGTAWYVHPIEFRPVFTRLAPDPADHTFKADISYRGVEVDGLETELKLPYGLDLWDEAPTVVVMHPDEIIAEKILGWCAHRRTKHYADLAFIAIVSQPGPNRLIEFNPRRVLDVLEKKLETMSELQPDYYAHLPDVDAVLDDLAKPPRFDRREWMSMIYLRAQRDRFTQSFVTKAVQTLLLPRLRS